jgi:LacI family transcriptional regulator
MSERRVTLADVARLAGLSPSAASLILNDRPGTRLSLDATRRVRQAAAELGYRPNVAARGLRTAQTNTIGFISDGVAVSRFATGLIRGALLAADAASHVLLVTETASDRDREASAIVAVLDRQVDGIIFAAARAREIALPSVTAGTRVVLLNVTSENVTSSVQPDEFQGGRTAVAALADAGHRGGIVLVGQDTMRTGDRYRSPNIESRVSGVFAEMQARGLTFDRQIPVDVWTPDEAHEAVSHYLAEGGRPRCVLVLNDPMAFGVYRALADAGLRVPGDVSVVSFDNDELAEFLWPRLTTVALPHEAMGAAAVDLLLSGTEGLQLIPMPLVVRDSLAGPSL